MISPSQIASMERTQARSMGDVCTIDRITVAGADSTETSNATTGVACGWSFEGGSRTDEGTKENVSWDAVCRLPRSTAAINMLAKVTPTAIKGKTVSGWVFKLAAMPEIGPTATTLYLKRVTN